MSFPSGKLQCFFQTVLCQRPSSGNRHILRVSAGADDCDIARRKRWRQPSSSPSELSCPCSPWSFYFYFCPWYLEAKPSVVSLFLQLYNSVSNRILLWTEFLSRIWCQRHYILYYLLCNDSIFLILNAFSTSWHSGVRKYQKKQEKGEKKIYFSVGNKLTFV